VDRETLAAAVARHLEGDFGGEPGKKDALLLLAGHLDQLMNERPSAASIASPVPSQGLDEATLRRVVREVVCEALPLRADADAPAPAVNLAKLVRTAVAAALADDRAAKAEKARHEALAEARRWPEGETPSPTHPKPGMWVAVPNAPKEPVAVAPTELQKFGVVFTRIGSWFGLCKFHGWR